MSANTGIIMIAFLGIMFYLKITCAIPESTFETVMSVFFLVVIFGDTLYQTHKNEVKDKDKNNYPYKSTSVSNFSIDNIHNLLKDSNDVTAIEIKRTESRTSHKNKDEVIDTKMESIILHKKIERSDENQIKNEKKDNEKNEQKEEENEIKKENVVV